MDHIKRTESGNFFKQAALILVIMSFTVGIAGCGDDTVSEEEASEAGKTLKKFQDQQKD